MTFDGVVPWVPDAPGADLLVVVGTGDDGAPVAGVVRGRGVAIERSGATTRPARWAT